MEGGSLNKEKKWPDLFESSEPCSGVKRHPVPGKEKNRYEGVFTGKRGRFPGRIFLQQQDVGCE